jgi:hypothetical protein
LTPIAATSSLNTPGSLSMVHQPSMAVVAAAQQRRRRARRVALAGGAHLTRCAERLGGCVSRLEDACSSVTPLRAPQSASGRHVAAAEPVDPAQLAAGRVRGVPWGAQARGVVIAELNSRPFSSSGARLNASVALRLLWERNTRHGEARVVKMITGVGVNPQRRAAAEAAAPRCSRRKRLQGLGHALAALAAALHSGGSGRCCSLRSAAGPAQRCA